MTMKQFQNRVRQVMETLPAEFYPHLDNLVVEVDDEPTDELLRRAGFTDEEIDDGETLLGLFDPLEVPPWGGDSVDTHDMLHRLWIFKRPHEEEFPEPAQLAIEIRKTVIHELAHHFGFDERDLERFDDNPNPFEKEKN